MKFNVQTPEEAPNTKLVQIYPTTRIIGLNSIKFIISLFRWKL